MVGVVSRWVGLPYKHKTGLSSCTAEMIKSMIHAIATHAYRTYVAHVAVSSSLRFGMGGRDSFACRLAVSTKSRHRTLITKKTPATTNPVRAIKIRGKPELSKNILISPPEVARNTVNCPNISPEKNLISARASLYRSFMIKAFY